MSELQLDPNLVATLAALQTHRVEFVLVGDLANAIYDHGGIVSAVAIVPGGYGRNVDRLAHALGTLNAELGIAGRPDPRALDWRQMDLRELAPCTFMTAYADVDIDFQPAGTSGFRDLFQDADRFEIGRGVHPYVASPEDLDRVGHASAPAPAPVQLPTPPPAPAEPSYTPPGQPYEPPYATPEHAYEPPYATPDHAYEPPYAPAEPAPAAAELAPPAPRAPAVRPPGEEDDYDPGIWTEEEFRAIRSGRITF